MCGRCFATYYGETDRHLKSRSREHIGILPMAFDKIKPSKKSAILDNLFKFNNITSFEEFTILTNVTNKFVLEIKRKTYLLDDIDLF